MSAHAEDELMEIVAQREYHRLDPADYPQLVVMRDHYSAVFDDWDGAVKNCPVAARPLAATPA